MKIYYLKVSLALDFIFSTEFLFKDFFSSQVFALSMNFSRDFLNSCTCRKVFSLQICPMNNVRSMGLRDQTASQINDDQQKNEGDEHDTYKPLN